MYSNQSEKKNPIFFWEQVPMALQRKCKNIKSLFSGEKCNYQNKLKVHFAVTVIATP